MIPATRQQMSSVATLLMVGRRRGFVDCLRERGQSAPGPWFGAKQRDRRAAGHWRESMAHRAAAIDRKCIAGRDGRNPWSAARMVDGRRVESRTATARSFADCARLRHRRAGVVIYFRAVDAGSDRFWIGSRTAYVSPGIWYPLSRMTPSAPANGPHRFNLRSMLVVTQVALSLVLLIAAGLFLRSLQKAQAIDPGFDAQRVLTVPLNINLLRYTTTQGREFYRQVIERVESLPGVESASLARIVALSGGASVRSLLIEGRAGSDNQFRSEGSGTGAGGDGTQLTQT